MGRRADAVIAERTQYIEPVLQIPRKRYSNASPRSWIRSLRRNSTETQKAIAELEPPRSVPRRFATPGTGSREASDRAMQPQHDAKKWPGLPR